MDFIDLYQIHRWDPNTPIDDHARCARFAGARRQGALPRGKQHGGVATLEGFVHGERNAWHSFSTMQNHYNLVYREEERETIPLCMDQGLGIIRGALSRAAS